MFETTKATDFICHFPSSAVFFTKISQILTSSGWGRGKPNLVSSIRFLLASSSFFRFSSDQLDSGEVYGG